MGTMTFLLPARSSADVLRDLQWSCPTGGADSMPVRAEVRVEPERLTLRRTVNESGCVNIPWFIEGAGHLMGKTTTLRQRDAPYRLLIELVRGKVHQIRSQATDWRASGLHVSSSLEEHVRAAG